jgi:hypothetical protein
VLLIILFHSCESSSEVALQNEEFVNPYEFVGEIHNAGLEFILNKCNIEKGAEISIQEICDLTTNFMLSSPENNFMNYDGKTYKELGEIIIAEMNGGYNKRAIEYQILEEGTLANQYLTDLRMIVYNVDFNDSISSFKKIKKIEKDIWTSKISEENKAILLSMSAVGKHSYSYWKKNLPKYINSENSKSADGRDVAIEILKSDFEGALVGFIAGGIIGAIGGSVIMPGVGTITAFFLDGIQGAAYGAIITSLLRIFLLYVVPLV